MKRSRRPVVKITSDHIDIGVLILEIIGVLVDVGILIVVCHH